MAWAPTESDYFPGYEQGEVLHFGDVFVPSCEAAQALRPTLLRPGSEPGPDSMSRGPRCRGVGAEDGAEDQDPLRSLE